jgi:putative membrane-bound dehydrogenase-like protein
MKHVIGWSVVFGLALVVSSGHAEEKSQPLEPAEALQHFALPEDLQIELVASEPLVCDPVAIAFDDQGQLFVVEYRDYPNGPGEGKPPLSRIRLLRDRDGDGTMEDAVTFAENLSFAQGLMAWNGGLLVTSAPELLYLKDTNGDGRADERTVLFQGFQPGNPQLRTAHPRRGIDNWIYLTNGLSNGEVTKVGSGDGAVSLQGHDFRFHPQSMAFEPAPGFGQFGNTFDDVGHRFFCSNRNPTMVAILPYRALVRNPWINVGKGYEDIAPFGGDAKVYPAAKTNTTAFEHTGSHTAACGVTVHRGTGLGEDYQGCVYVCEPTGYLVTRSKLQPKGVSLQAERAVPGKDFLTSDDTWFRPVSLADGPDGALYVVDMYRQVIEHPQYMPPGLAETLDLRAGDDRGRIYRIRAKEKTLAKFQPSSDPTAWTQWLEDPNGWRRDLAQRLLVERGQKDVVPQLADLLKSSGKPLARLHALWTLEGLGALDRDHLLLALQDTDPVVRSAGAKLASTIEQDSAVADRLRMLVDDPDPRVAFEVALAVGESPEPDADRLLASIAKGYDDPWVRRAILTSCKDHAAGTAALLVREPAFAKDSASNLSFLGELAESAGRKGDPGALALLAGPLAEASAEANGWQAAIVGGIIRGLKSGSSDLSKKGLTALRQHPPAELESLIKEMDRVLGAATKVAVNSSVAPADRGAALGLVGFLPFEEVAGVVKDVLSQHPAPELQAAAIDALEVSNDPKAAAILLPFWSTLSPEPQRLLADFCLLRPDSTRLLLEAMKEGIITPASLSIEQRTRVLASRDPNIAPLAKELLGGEVSANRKEVVDKYRPALTGVGHQAEGYQVFRRVCATCHRVRGEGHDVGPDLTDVRNKTPETLLVDILDPNRAVEPRFAEYVVAMQDGRVLTGLLMGETENDIVLRRAENKEDRLPRREIESLRASGRSVMPEGVEKDVTPEQLADLIAFLKDEAKTASAP